MERGDLDHIHAVTYVTDTICPQP